MVAKQLEEVFQLAANLSEQEQIELAERILDDMIERGWQKRFDATRPMLRRMAQEARREIEAGEFDDLELESSARR